ncbi:MAG: Ldh family oxidoreductase [Acidimicrobiia bacterium]|nr:Ldh family oxidoreductase [Acidimicrobiia bacterium]
MSGSGEPGARVDAAALRRFTSAVLRTYDVPVEHADLTAEVLVAADACGIDSHGVSRLGLYTLKLERGLVNPRPRPRIVRETATTCVVDGDNGLGPVAAVLAMDWCIERARDVAVACASVGHGNHYGIAGWYARRALPHAMIGLSLTNATSLVAPTFGRRPLLGTNPIAVAVPAGRERPFVLDMATSAVSAGKLQLAMAAGEPIPEGWAVDAEGRGTTDPLAGFGGALLPLGSTRELGSHKGYGLAVVVDVLSALLSGAAFGPHCLSLTSELDQVANVGHFFAAVRVDAFRPFEEFTAAMDDMIRGLREAPPAPGHDRVVVAGEPELDEEDRRGREGIPLDAGTVESLRGLAVERRCEDELGALLGR